MYNLFDNDVEDLGDHYCLATEEFRLHLKSKVSALKLSPSRFLGWQNIRSGSGVAKFDPI